MAIKHARKTIRDVIDETSLDAFEDAVEVADRLYRIMEETTDPDKAFTTAVGWATSILTLARLESSLLASVLPLYEEELDPTSEKIDALNQRKADVENAVYSLRGDSGHVMPLSMRVDPARAHEIHEAKKARADVYMEVRTEMAKLSEEREPIQLTIGRIKRTLRSLTHFVENRFPVPTRSRNPMATARPDGDPITSFAQKYVANMGKKGVVDKQRAALERARAHPINRYDRSGQELH